MVKRKADPSILPSISFLALTGNLLHQPTLMNESVLNKLADDCNARIALESSDET